LVLAAQGYSCYRSWAHLGELHVWTSSDRIRLYGRTIFFQWLMLGLVLAGVWWHSSSVLTVLGERWSSLSRFLCDLGIGVVFLMLAIMMGAILPHGDDHAARLILPQGRVEMWLWLALSLTAGICEEALFRGYLQRQFLSLTKSAPAGIVLSAAAFAGAHAYQGWPMALQIGLLGVIAGTIAYWCKSVRPGMIEHVLQDILGGFMGH
jgi:membrane protease YdiL (CAAX protease family)